MSEQAPDNSVFPKDRDEWRAWLADNHTQDEGVWLIRYKKSAGKPILNFDDAVEEALCFGWIDSLPRKLDDERTMLYFAPRKVGSNWSGLNKERVQKMIDAGRMTEAGMVKIEVAKADGSWDALNDVENLVVPPDLDEAFAKYPDARANWDEFPPFARRGILEWILNAKRDATRQKRIDETARLAQENIRANQWR
ncbi:MAG: YdeI/OmpD-associated family protein [Chloroflexota bacterium]